MLNRIALLTVVAVCLIGAQANAALMVSAVPAPAGPIEGNHVMTGIVAQDGTTYTNLVAGTVTAGTAGGLMWALTLAQPASFNDAVGNLDLGLAVLNVSTSSRLMFGKVLTPSSDHFFLVKNGNVSEDYMDGQVVAVDANGNLLDLQIYDEDHSANGNNNPLAVGNYHRNNGGDLLNRALYGWIWTTDDFVGTGDRSQVAGIAFTAATVDPVSFGYVVPEPASLSVLGLGALSLLLRRRK